MIELSTIFIKNVDGRFQSLGRIICEYCDHVYSTVDFHKAVFLYGVYFLVSPTDGYLGTKCINPECTRTLALKGSREEIDHIKDDLFSFLDLRIFQLPQPDFRYHSPLEYSPDQYPFLQRFDIIPSYWNIGGFNPSTVDGLVRAHEQQEAYLTDKYLNSFIEGCGNPTGDNFSAWWFKKKQVENLIKIEDEKQIRIFPRYMVFDPLYSETQSFCWSYHFAQKFYGDLNLPAATEIRTGNKDKNIITRNYDFSSILEIAPYAAFGSTQVVLSSAGHSFSHIKKHIDMLNNESDMMERRLLEHEKMVDELWGNYRTQYMHEQLARLSTDFIFDYVEIALRTDFSYNSLWKLKTEYLENISDSTRSRRKRALNKKISREKHQKLVAKECPAFQHIISHNDEINEIKLELTRLAGNPRKNKIFLLLGDTGTGKMLFAEGIHGASGDKKRPFVRANCANLPENIFESEVFGHKKGAFTGADRDKQGLFLAADGGTILLDEVGNLTKENQGKLLTVLDGTDRIFTPLGTTKPVTVEVTTILATNKDLREEVTKGNFLKDLRMRINTLPSTIPPLRERGKTDLELLIKHLIKKEAVLCKKQEIESVGIAAEALDILAHYSWPGNVRELENMITKIIMLRDDNDTSDISYQEIAANLPEPRSSSDKKSRSATRLRPAAGKRKMPPKEDVEKLLKKHNHIITKTAEEIGVSREYLSKEVKRMGLRKTH